MAGVAQVTTNITSSGLGTNVTPAGTIHNITGGMRRGANLFHSFGLFNVGAGDTANFLNETGLATSNIMGRVNGGQTSNIFGTIQTTDFGSANLFLINPVGWIFGPSASLNVGGSFHVSTADYIRLNDGVRFNAAGTNDALLTSAPPAAFGFLGANPTASISVNGSLLQVPEGQTLSLVGGNVQVTADGSTGTPAVLSAPSGQIQIGSFASAGEATIAGLNGNFATLGSVDISSSSIAATDVEGDPAIVNGGSVLIRGGQIGISGGSSIDISGIQLVDADFNPIGGTASGSVVIRGGRLLIDGSTITAQTFGSDSSAPAAIDIEMADTVELRNGTSVGTATSGLGTGGGILVKASDASLDASFVNTSTFGDGSAGDITVDVARLNLSTGAGINSLTTFGSGAAGNLTVLASDSVTLSGASILSNEAFNGNTGDLTVTTQSLKVDEASGIVTTAIDLFFSGGTPGDLLINAGELSVTAGSQIASNASTLERGGSIIVHADSALISGTDSGGAPSKIFSFNSAGGAVGDISVNVTRNFTLTGGAVIDSGTATDPQGGNVAISAGDSIVISNGSGISLRAFSQDVGEVTISAPTGRLTIDNGFISTSTTEAGRAGAVTVNARTVELTHGGQITSSSEAFATGAGGSVTINAESLSISGRSPDNVPVTPFSNDPRSGIFTTTAGIGAGGNIEIQAGNIALKNGGIISTSSFGKEADLGSQPGTAGNVRITIGDTLFMDGGTITTSAAEAAGGDITITHTGSLINMIDSQITTSVNGGLGGGGNITIGAERDSAGNVINIDSFDFITLNNSGIHANAFGGPGGNINIFTNLLLSSVPIETAITASSALNTPGTIDIQATVTEFSSDTSQLPDVPLQAAELLRATCSVRVASGRLSSLVLGGRGGLPLEPGGLLPSPLYPSTSSTSDIDKHRPAELPKFSRSKFSILSDAQPSPYTSWHQFQLAKTALGLNCSQ
ncbi:MAG TPA: filamentous hemagglutinin N-terminal domain-containing protein [Candidatus Binatia bacterium]|nr:filamentous hemagglutinin N-terminal domain-containing protein [Candidatus Binatia bacterium]